MELDERNIHPLGCACRVCRTREHPWRRSFVPQRQDRVRQDELSEHERHVIELDGCIGAEQIA
ncbi:MAG TPA: hypothetical protein VKU60_19860 [Chloroflexota bacterium]|nr:hypothetical protein [Chloroflexota bacterium]